MKDWSRPGLDGLVVGSSFEPWHRLCCAERSPICLSAAVLEHASDGPKFSPPDRVLESQQHCLASRSCRGSSLVCTGDVSFDFGNKLTTASITFADQAIVPSLFHGYRG